jgi:hypothetical protein
MRKLILMLAAVSALQASAAPVIEQVTPTEGFNFAPTQVTIFGSGFMDGDVEVFFGDVKANFYQKTPTKLVVQALPTPEGGGSAPGFVDITVRVAGHGEAKFPNFYFHPHAQVSRFDTRMVLVPLTQGTFPGADGSRWTTEFRVFNTSLISLRLSGPEQIFYSPPIDPGVIIESRQTEKIEIPGRDQSLNGAFLYIPRPLANAPKFSLRVVDISQNAGNLGYEIPIVRDDQFLKDLAFIDVPSDPNHRAALRVYSSTAAPMQVGMTVYPEDGDTPIEHRIIDLNGVSSLPYDEFPPYPAFAAVDPFTTAVRAYGGRVRIELNSREIPPLGPSPMWAFLSLTNNETQQVTIVTPRELP